jgi:hypothetical protein
MNNRSQILRIIATIALFVALGEQVVAQSGGPEDMVKALYATYNTGGNWVPAASNFLSQSLLRIFNRAMSLNAIDGDFFCQCSDPALVKPVVINSVSTKGSTSTVSATITLAPRQDTKTFDILLVKEPPGWRIANAFIEHHPEHSVISEWNQEINGVIFCQTHHC